MDKEPEIIDVDLTFRTNLARDYWGLLISYIIFCLAWAFGILYFFSFSESTMVIAMLPVLLLMAILTRMRNQVLSKFYQQFAEANGYTFSIYDSSFRGEAGLFEVGNDRQYSNIVRGYFNEHPICIFNYRYSVGSGKNKETYHYTVFELDYDHQIAKFFLRSDRQKLSAVVPKFQKKTRLKLEGDFDNYFDLFVEDQFEIEGLQLFAPNIMARLMDDWKGLNMESSGDKIYIYQRHRVSNKTGIQSMYSMAKYFIEKFAPTIKRMESSTIAMKEKFLVR